MFKIDDIDFDIDFDEDLDEESFKGASVANKAESSKNNPCDSENKLNSTSQVSPVCNESSSIFKLPTQKSEISPTSLKINSVPIKPFTPKKPSFLNVNRHNTTPDKLNNSYISLDAAGPSTSTQYSPLRRSTSEGKLVNDNAVKSNLMIDRQNANSIRPKFDVLPSTSKDDKVAFLSNSLIKHNELKCVPNKDNSSHAGKISLDLLCEKKLCQPTYRQTDKIVRQRKFPGPAGLLPQRISNTSLIATEDFLNELENETNNREYEEKEVLSQQTGSFFENSDSWLALLEDLGPCGSQLMGSLNLSLFPKVLKRNLRGCKIPFLAVMVMNVDCTLQDPFLQLKDTSGEIPAILHRDVWDSWNSEICPGSVLVLRNVGVISAGVLIRRCILNITENNITAIYYSKPEHKKVQLKMLSHLPTVDESLEILQEWKKIMENVPTTPIRRPGVNSNTVPLFNHFPLDNFGEPPEKKICSSLPPQGKVVNPNPFKLGDNALVDSFLEGLDTNELFCDF
ncbi:uncharacterized protein LOC106662373 [Cimex lectularius]|uniref:Homologous recombination OB-fold protein OB-fold domain-containing protein n=1 Tax=Cimex lectularius TaxID=79782 RepID=A0A8I6RB68_CIMLE|nr:uncharacterized protein LOC106662373 [Cimex lectularius]